MQQVIAEAFIPTLYAIAMAVDAVFALVIGRVYDKIGSSSLVVLTLLIALLAFTYNNSTLVVEIASLLLFIFWKKYLLQSSRSRWLLKYHKVIKIKGG